MKKLLKVSGFSALLTLLRMGSGFVIAKVVAAHTGPVGIAMLGQLQSLVVSLAGIVSSPVGSGIVRYTAQYLPGGDEAIAPWWRAAIKMAFGMLLLVMPLVLLLAAPISRWIFGVNDYAWLVMLVALGLPLTVINSVVQSILNGLQRYRSYVLLGMLSVTLTTGCMVGVVAMFGLPGALACAALFSAFSGLILLIGVVREPWLSWHQFFGKVSPNNFRGIAKYMTMALVSAIVIPVALIIVRNILVAEVGWEQAGMWQAVWKISEVYLAVVTMSLGTYYLPRLSGLTTYIEIKAEISSVARVVIPLVAFLAIAIYLCRDWIIWLLFTEKFRPARDLFAIQLVGDVVKIVSWLLAYPMLSRGTVSWFIATELLFGSSFVFFSWQLIPTMGAQGANISYLITYLICLTFVWSNLKKFTQG